GAFEALARQAETIEADRVVGFIGEFARVTGADGLIGGEQADVVGEELPPDADLLDYIHLNKTAKLIRAACRCGGVLADCPPDQLQVMTDYGTALGILFQVTDDILDVVGDEEVLGKPVGADEATGKQTWPDVWGLDGARREAQRLSAEAARLAAELPAENEFWASLPELVVSRDK
ncbi:MAG: polyprenyl synthetase family protein, partial [Armatimonadetes bacterium]|nr:polyprenyl synthetase family protein [Armatimonadota bacterium]